jgi:hypothetical protein
MAFSGTTLDTSTILGGKGSIRARYATCTSTGSLTSAVYNLPVSKDFEVSVATSQGNTKDEAGNQYLFDDVTTGTAKFTLLQQDASSRKFAQDLGGQYIAMIKEMGVSGTNKVTYCALVAKVQKNFQMKNPGGETPVELFIPYNTSAITLTGATFQDTSWLNPSLGNITIPVGQFVGITETSY